MPQIYTYIPLYKEFEYAYANGRVWALENRLLDREKLLRMTEAGTAEEAIRSLDGTEYAESLKSLNTDAALEKLVYEFYNFLSSFFPEKEIIKAFLTKHELYNKKIFSKFKEEEIEDRIIEVDKKILEQKLKLSREIKNFEDILKAEIDLLNLKILLRAKKLGNAKLFEKAFFDGGNIKKESFSKELSELSLAFERTYSEKYKNLPELYFSSPSYFDRECDNLILEKVKSLRKIFLGPEPLIAYIYEKENEIRNIGIILKGKALGVGRDEIKKLLRE